MEVRFEVKVTRGFSVSPRRFRDSLSPLRGLLLISFAKKNQEKPLGPGYQELFPTLFVKTTDFQLVFKFDQTRTVTIFGELGIMAHMMAKLIRVLELHYPMIRFLIMCFIIFNS